MARPFTAPSLPADKFSFGSAIMVQRSANSWAGYETVEQAIDCERELLRDVLRGHRWLLAGLLTDGPPTPDMLRRSRTRVRQYVNQVRQALAGGCK